MSKAKKTAITPTRSENYPEWYQKVIKAADLAETTAVRGCMVIKPWGYAIWEIIQAYLDKRIKDTGHENIYCPLFLPLHFLEKEAQQVEGFAKECAVVTHHGLQADANGKLIPTGKLEEPLVVRPTSETMIGTLFANWTQSYRDLPILVNQWANVVRWEMRTRMFLRNSEFLWQEGHTAHADKAEAEEKTKQMLEIYAELAEDFLAVPVIQGEKTAGERFPGAEKTLTIEAMMQDKKALQAGTSHFLGQNFSRAFEVSYLNQTGQEEFAWTTSWGVTTRLIGGLIMTHSDDNGLVLPPKVAPLHIVIIPVIHDDKDAEAILAYSQALARVLQAKIYAGQAIRVKVDNKPGRTGEKLWHWIKKGVPLRIEIGAKELAAQSICLARRDSTPQDKQIIPRDELVQRISALLTDIQDKLFLRAKTFRENNTVNITTKKDFYDFFDKNNKKSGGFAIAAWIGDTETEQALQKDLAVTARCIPLQNTQNNNLGTCIFTGKNNAPYTVFARAY